MLQADVLTVVNVQEYVLKTFLCTFSTESSSKISTVCTANIKQVPILGTVTAGAPILAVEQVEGYLPYTGYAAKDKSLFALRVKGESMLNAGIFDGDLVVVERTPVARNGEIVVALVEDEATVKTFYKENGHFRLQPENDAYEPIIVDEAVILGKVVALHRYY